MTRSSHHVLTAALALVLAAIPCATWAQEVVQAIPGTTDADRLGDMMRQIASNPRDVDALVRAGDLSMALGDLSGAAALFARAEKVNSRDGRVKAGMASILVRSERPGEALRYYAQAEGLGLDAKNFAADRGLAYDLIGQQDRAQRDYRVALRAAPDDETVRRYALSLGISGKQDLALQQLAPLLQKSDRGAWRSRAFIMAMNGDVSGAEKIATTMMPRGTAQGLQPFFQRLPTLPAVDRAFAVHFGEVHATPARLADARMTPPLGMLAADPTAPVMLASMTQPLAVATDGAKKGRRDRRSKPDRVELAAAVTRAQGPMASAARTSPTPAVTTAASPYAAPVQRAAAPMQMVQAVPARQPALVQQVLPAPQTLQAPQPTYLPPTAVAQAVTRLTPAPESSVAVTTAQPVGVGGQGIAPPASVASVTPRPVASVAPSVSVAAVTRPTTSPTVSGALPPSIVTQMAAIPVGQSAPDATRAANALAASAVPVSSAVRQAGPATPTPGFSTGNPAAESITASVAPPVATASVPPPERTGALAASDDSILARIVAGLSIPASELGVAPMHAAPVVAPATIPAATPVSVDAERVLAEAKAKTERDAAAKAIAAKTLAAETLAADRKAAADKKAAARKAIADKKLLAEKKAAAAEKLAADKAAAEEKRIARANPERIWVQVSTGATEGDLPKAWKGAKAKAPAAFGARAGWTTPWKATNRVLAGPFKTNAEARTFVNQLAKEGVSTFSFTSDPGQIITKLPAK